MCFSLHIPFKGFIIKEVNLIVYANVVNSVNKCKQTLKIKKKTKSKIIKTMNKLQFINKIYYLKQDNPNIELILNKDLITNQINKFFEELDIKEDNKHILILFRTQYESKEIATIGKLQRLNFNDISINKFINYIIDILLIKDDHYKNEQIKIYKK